MFWATWHSIQVKLLGPFIEPGLVVVPDEGNRPRCSGYATAFKRIDRVHARFVTTAFVRSQNEDENNGRRGWILSIPTLGSLDTRTPKCSV